MKLNNAAAVYVGANAADAVYLGNALVWSAGAPVCLITLTHDGLDAFGLAPMSVTGQTVSVTADGVSEYGMSDGLAGKPVDWTGVRIVAKKVITNPVIGYAILHLVKPDLSLSARIIWSQGDGEWQVETRNLVSDTRTGFVRVGGAVTDRPALGVDGATGDVTAYLNGDVVVTKDTTASSGSFSGLGGMFATDNVTVLDVAWHLGSGDTYSAEIITQHDKYEDAYPAGTKDWCGNPLTPADPISILGAKLAAWYTPEPSTLFTTSTGETRVTSASDPIGLRLDKSKGVVLGPEVIPDPSFDDAGAWTLSGASVIGGQAVWTAAAGSSFVRAAGATTLSRYYEVTLVVDSISAGGLAIATSTGAGLSQSPTVSAPGTYTFRIIASGANNNFQIFSIGSSTTAAVSSVTCREIAGNHAFQTVPTARPLWQTGPDRIVYDGVDDALQVTIPTGGWSGTFFNATTQGVIVGTYSVPAGTYQLPTNPLYSGSLNNDVGIILCDGVASAEEIAKTVQWLRDNAAAGDGIYSGSLSAWMRGRSDITSIDASTLDVSSATIFNGAWRGTSIVDFPLIDVSAGTSFLGTWLDCTGLTSFPANFFDGCFATNFGNAFAGTNLTQTSVDNILVSINSNGTSGGTFNQSGGSAPSATGEAAIDAMRLRGWTVTVTGSY